MYFRKLILMLIALCGMVSYSTTVHMQSAPRRKLLAIAMAPRLEPKPANSNSSILRFVEALNLAYDAGSRGDVYTKHWNELESAGGQFTLDDFVNGANYTGGTRGFSFMFGIQLINTIKREVPDDLKDVPFDSPIMLNRFHALIDALAPHLDSHFLYLSIGNEVDVYLANKNEWKAYKTFYDDAVAYVHKKMPGLKVGVTVTFDGATKRSIDEIRTLTESSDIYIVTYYPLNSDFSVREPNAPLTDFPMLLKLADKRPLIMQEVGYPASTSLNSSEQKQADFVTNVYKAWDETGGQIPLLSFFLEHDLTEGMCKDLVAYYGLPNVQNFYEYLCTLGFRKADGTPRKAWDAFVNGAKAIGLP